MLAEVARICAAIPHRDLAIQWDVCIEMIQWDGRAPLMPPFPGMEQVFAATFTRLASAVPADVELGYHLCYGDMDAKHFVEPEDLSKAVSLANLIIAGARRSVNWIHMPVPLSRDDAAYFAPLKELKRTPGMELYLGLVHATDGVDGTVRRMKAARAYAHDFGIATECGISRSRTSQMVRNLMEVHAKAAKDKSA
jgi:methionine synthase II (cobalamin-independent)